jgi:hypothetical protein
MTTGRRSKTTDATIFPSAAEAEDELKSWAHRSGPRRRLAGDRSNMVWLAGRGWRRTRGEEGWEEGSGEGEERTLLKPGPWAD